MPGYPCVARRFHGWLGGCGVAGVLRDVTAVVRVRMWRTESHIPTPPCATDGEGGSGQREGKRARAASRKDRDGDIDEILGADAFIDMEQETDTLMAGGWRDALLGCNSGWPGVYVA